MEPKKFVTVVAIALIVIAGSGCMTEQEIKEQAYEQPQYEQRFTVVDAKEHSLSPKEKITVVHDNEENVTCYLYRGHGEGGVSISCIPDWQLIPPQVSNDCNCS